MARVVMILIAIACGVAGTMGMMAASRPQQKQTRYVDVVVATKFLGSGTIIDQTMVAKQRIPDGYKDPSAILWDDLVNDVLGQRLAVSVREGGMISSATLESTLEAEFESRIPHGYRAMSISVSSSTGVSGLLRPGSHVDIIAMFTETIGAGNITPTSKIKVLLQNVTILAVGRQTSTLMDKSGATSFGRSSSYSTITVAATLEEAEILIAAETRGKLYCVLRNPSEDPTPVAIPERSVNEALSPSSILQINEMRHQVQQDSAGSSQ